MRQSSGSLLGRVVVGGALAAGCSASPAASPAANNLATSSPAESKPAPSSPAPSSTAPSGSEDAGAGGSNAAADGATPSPGSEAGAGDGSCADDAGAPAGATVWADGSSQPTSVTIPAGSTVVIAPGATITMGAGALITVEGSLVGSSACGAHARLAWPAGAMPATGITVAAGGAVRLDGVDITGAGGALSLSGGASQYDHGTIDGASTPFSVGAGATLTTTGAAVTRAQGVSVVSGSLVASGLDYDANGNGGILAEDAATLDLRNTRLRSVGESADMIISEGSVGATVHVQNTEISGAHCAFHFGPADTFDIRYANIHDNAYGFMLFGSSGGGTVAYSNVDTSNTVAFAAGGNNGPITFDHSYVPGGSATFPISFTNPASSPVPGTGAM